MIDKKTRKSLPERVVKLEDIAEYYKFDECVAGEPTAKGTVPVTGRKGGWLLRTWIVKAVNGTRMTNLTAPPGMAFTDEARDFFKAAKSRHPGRMVLKSGSDLNCELGWRRACMVMQQKGMLRPMTDKELGYQAKASTAFGPKRAEVAAMLARILAAAQLDSVTNELVDEAQKIIDACRPPASRTA